MKDLLYSDIQYGATLVKSQLVHMCRSFPDGQAPTSSGSSIAVGDSCQVLAAWDGRENPSSRGAELFREFWYPDELTPSLTGVLGLASSPWLHPFSAADPVHTPYGPEHCDQSGPGGVRGRPGRPDGGSRPVPRRAR
ncbi:MAG TPA: penicillin acylase family protein [Streptosporangiaceae bacterium]|nr:penicillin acylase family protein [Streptosporangiaceae bacterium]